MLSFVALMVFTTALFAVFLDHIMRNGIPRPDLFLAAAAATPAASDLAFSSLSPGMEAPRFFTLPLLNVPWGETGAHLTAPDLLAIISSAVLLVRFAAWAVAPLIAARKRPPEDPPPQG